MHAVDGDVLHVENFLLSQIDVRPDFDSFQTISKRPVTLFRGRKVVNGLLDSHLPVFSEFRGSTCVDVIHEHDLDDGCEAGKSSRHVSLLSVAA